LNDFDPHQPLEGLEDVRPFAAPTPACPPGKSEAARHGLQELLGAVTPTELEELHAFWNSERGNGAAAPAEVLRDRLRVAMSDPGTVEARTNGLGKRLLGVLHALLGARHYQREIDDLAAHASLSYLSVYDLEAALAGLQRRGLVFRPAGSNDAQRVSWCVPSELGDALLRQRRSRERGVFSLLTLRGHLDRMYSDPARASRTSPQRLREMYKVYARESAAVARVERLPEGLKDFVGKAVLEFGGILPRGLFEQMETEMPHWNGRRWQLLLEQSLVGTVVHLDLSRYGILHTDESLVVFNEVALAWLRRVAVPSDPDRPHDEAAMGIDQISNLSRFLSYLHENDVHFTQRGDIFKTTEKRILQQLIPNPGRELSRDAILAWLGEFARHAGLIDRTGERTLALSARGREWGQKTLLEKLQLLLDHALEDRSLGGEHYHHLRLRQILLRLLRRVEVGTWYDLMYLPFLARNNYLASLDELHVEQAFSERNQSAHAEPMEDAQRLAWNLVRWMRQRLFLLGIIDLGYDKSGRPVALRLTRTGARLFEAPIDAPLSEPGIGSLVVTPDFEVVLFPSGDDDELVHDLDRFCVRDRQDAVQRFRISELSVRRALTSGMYLARLLQTLESHSRTPLPQNVRYSIVEWAHRAGLLTLDGGWVLKSENPDLLKRFQQDPGARAYIKEVLDERRVALKARSTPRRMQALLRDLGYLVELA
jgi:Helicase conserved C-terminal domain